MSFRLSLVLTTLILGTLSAQDVSGRWTGVADTTDEANTKRQEQQSFEIKSAVNIERCAKNEIAVVL